MEMFCQKCGTFIDDSAVSCQKCGAKVRQAGVTLKFKIAGACIVALLLVTLITSNAISFSLFSRTSNDAPNKSEGEGFSSPEAALRAYLEALRDEDLPRMISTFAIETYVEKHNFEGFLNRLNAWSPGMEIKMPNINEFATSMNVASRRTRVTDNILNQYLFLSECHFALEGKPITLQGERVREFIDEFNKILNARKFSTIEILGFLEPEELNDMYLNERNLSNMERIAGYMGVDQLKSCVAVFRLDRIDYYLCIDAVKFGGKWYIGNLGGNIGSILGINISHGGIIKKSLLME